ncbi:MAG TPA: hypothetical protein VNI52_03715 [Sphingobacteriaceae bacterium]|nr:hypothetical protein [Sphingobacteriaceae bacterium]
MKSLGLVLLLFLWTGLFSSGLAQHRSKYRAVIKTTGNMRYSGDFISVNDTMLVLTGPEKVNSSKKITAYKNTYITLKPEGITSIRINRKGSVEIGAVIGLVVGGVTLGLIMAGSDSADSGELFSDITESLAFVVTGITVGSIVGTAAGAQVGQLLSKRLNLKNLDLKDFSSVKNLLEPYQAKLIK